MSPKAPPSSSSSSTTTPCTELSRSSSAVSDLPTSSAASSSSGTTTPSSSELLATESMCHHCFDVLVHALHQQKGSSSSYNNNNHQSCFNSLIASIPDFTSYLNMPDFIDNLPSGQSECPLFVTWDKRRQHQHSSSPLSFSHQSQAQSSHNKFDLRGCIGTHSPKPLKTSIGEYALISALKDKRFRPVSIAELPYLRVAVSLLIRYEPCEHCHDWIVGLHGIIIAWVDEGIANVGRGGGREYSATYLPEVAADQGWDQATAVESLIRKAGFHGRITPALLQQLTCTRYQSSKTRVTFDEYLQVRSAGGGSGSGENSTLWMMIASEAAAAAAAAADGTASHHHHRGGNTTTTSSSVHRGSSSTSSSCVIS